MKQVIFLLAFQCITFIAFAQHTIKGKISDVNNKPLIGANVTIKGTYLGTISDSHGKYIFNNLKDGKYILLISYMGYNEIEKEINLTGDIALDFELEESVIVGEEVIISAIRAKDNTPTTYSYVSKDDIQKKNLGQDMPYLLSYEPSMVVTSDAGAGIGYTGIRIRGIDSRKINVTINGIPLNDAESHGVFWVDIPDISGSTNSIQIQRGIGTSTNGSGAFGASINMETDNISKKAFSIISTSIGSYNTTKMSLYAGTGLINNHWFLEGKFSKIKSDGYRDRAWSDLKSYFVQTGYQGKKSLLKFIAFGGFEETYQAWYGLDSAGIEAFGRTYNYAGEIYDKNWNVVDFYDNFIDHYQQDHYQLHFIHEINSKLKFNTAIHYTYGRGYYEEFYQNEDFELYNMEPLYFGYDSLQNSNGRKIYFYHDTIHNTDIVRQLWLDNDFYGGTWALNYHTGLIDLTFGGALNVYDDAKHFGEIIWAQNTSNTMPGDKFYENTSKKSDINSYIKMLYNPINNLTVFGDLQVRGINYSASGLNREYANNQIDIQQSFVFFNPKFGAIYKYNPQGNFYMSYAIANREPTRSDILDAPDNNDPIPETLFNLESGFKQRFNNIYAELNVYNMNYRNELVLTGELNDVGTPIRKNVGESTRKGIESVIDYSILSNLSIAGNISLSKNKTDYIEETDTGLVTYKNADISFSPNIIAGGKIMYSSIKNLETIIFFKYVGSQYLDNTENNKRKLESYSIFNAQVNYKFNLNNVSIECNVLINNLLNTEYNSNASLWDGVPYYYPQALRNYLAGIKIIF